MKYFIKKTVYKLKVKYSKYLNRFGYMLTDWFLKNINIDYTNPNQKRVLICYTYLPRHDQHIFHANKIHLMQIIRYFIKKDYCIDLANHADSYLSKQVSCTKYDIIFGQGSLYEEVCKQKTIPVRINFITENHPTTVSEKYKERISYFKMRHPNINTNAAVERRNIFTINQFSNSTHGILMNSSFNKLNFKEFSFLKCITSNALTYDNINFADDEFAHCIEQTKNNILWFGASGLIHKGLDILIDAVKYMPNVTLNCYGIDTREYKLFNKLKSKNTHNKGTINVASENFLKEVVFKHNFVIFPSCSEGMSTGIATCMSYGIIPIITPETGFERAPYIFELQDYSVENLINMINKCITMPNEEIIKLRKECREYALHQFSIQHFDVQFNEIMNEILNH